MKITICGSTAFMDEMEKLAAELEKLGHKAHFPPLLIPGPAGKLIPAKEYRVHKKSSTSNSDWVWKNHFQRIQDHFDKVEWSDAILVANYDKNDVPGYIGANTLMEMGLAFYLKKPIFLLKPIPEISYKEEILGVQPIVINENLAVIK